MTDVTGTEWVYKCQRLGEFDQVRGSLGSILHEMSVADCWGCLQIDFRSVGPSYISAPLHRTDVI